MPLNIWTAQPTNGEHSFGVLNSEVPLYDSNFSKLVFNEFVGLAIEATFSPIFFLPQQNFTAEAINEATFTLVFPLLQSNHQAFGINDASLQQQFFLPSINFIAETLIDGTFSPVFPKLSVNFIATVIFVDFPSEDEIVVYGFVDEIEILGSVDEVVVYGHVGEIQVKGQVNG